jgi:chemotaxis methyl-accepting protein methylase
MASTKFNASMAVLDCEVTEIRLLLEQHNGVLLQDPAEVLAGSIAEHLQSREMPSAAELISALRSSRDEREALLERLVDGITGFFRCPPAFEALQNDVIPEINRRKNFAPARSLRIWSAGCSSGEEVYSIAIAVCEALAGASGGWTIHIVGSDIRRNALQFAERGLYHQRTLQGVPGRLVTQYFTRIGDHYLVKPRLRNLVKFAPMNLAQPSYLGHFDCIFCMDVLPHFSAAQRAASLERLRMYLEPGGYLFLGENENLPASEPTLTKQRHLAYTYYQRPLAAVAKAGKS